MIGDLGRFIVDVIEFIWPFRIVEEWEAGAYYMCGKYVGRTPKWLRPVPVVPWFFDVRTVDMVPDVFSTEEQTIEVMGGGTLTFTASVRLRVVDPGLALNNVVDHEENAVEDVAAILADTLASMDEERLDGEKRRSLLRKCQIDVNRELEAYGMTVEKIRFTNFIRNIRAYRLISSGITVSGDD
jgi:regulator of protease activity HflC (stomatin/prohibitin superfamily)